MKNLIFTPLFMLAVSACSQTSCIDGWQNVHVYEDNLPDSVKNLRFKKVEITTNKTLKDETANNEMTLKTVKANAYAYGATHIQILHTAKNKTYDTMTPLMAGSVNSAVVIYFFKNPSPTLEQINSICQNSKKFRILEKHKINAGISTEPPATTAVKIIKLEQTADGVAVQANVPAEWEQNYIITKAGEGTITMYSPKEQTVYLLAPIP